MNWGCYKYGLNIYVLICKTFECPFLLGDIHNSWNMSLLLYECMMNDWAIYEIHTKSETVNDDDACKYWKWDFISTLRVHKNICSVSRKKYAVFRQKTAFFVRFYCWFDKNRKNRKIRIFFFKKTETEFSKTETESETLALLNDFTLCLQHEFHLSCWDNTEGTHGHSILRDN